MNERKPKAVDEDVASIGVKEEEEEEEEEAEAPDQDVPCSDSSDSDEGEKEDYEQCKLNSIAFNQVGSIIRFHSNQLRMSWIMNIIDHTIIIWNWLDDSIRMDFSFFFF